MIYKKFNKMNIVRKNILLCSLFLLSNNACASCVPEYDENQPHENLSNFSDFPGSNYLPSAWDNYRHSSNNAESIEFVENLITFLQSEKIATNFEPKTVNRPTKFAKITTQEKDCSGK